MTLNNNKINNVKYLLNSEDIKKTLAEAWSAPIGSTKREKARAILRTVKNNKNDGMGGNFQGITYDQYKNMMFNKDNANDGVTKKKKYVIFPSINIKNDGKGGCKNDGKGGNETNPFFSNELAYPKQENNERPLSLFGDGSSSPIDLENNETKSPVSGVTTAQTIEQNPYKTPVQETTNSFNLNIPEGQTNNGQQSGVQTPQQTGAQPSGATPNVGELTGDGSSLYYDDSGNLVDKDKYMGAEHFATSVMSDSKLLKEYFPGLDEKDYPSASLVGQIADLRDTLKEEYKLDDLLNRKNEILDRGQTLKTDLTDYIKGRDQYMSKIEKMMDDAKQKMLTMDMANPETGKKMENYMKYLNTLKGRQNKRYIEYLNKSIDQHNAELSSIDNEYNANLEAFTQELNTQSALSQERYNAIKNALVEMYNYEDQRIDRNLQRDLLKAQVDKTNQEVILNNLQDSNYDLFKYKDKILDAITQDRVDPETGKVENGDLLPDIGEMIQKVSLTDVPNPEYSTYVILDEYLKPVLESSENESDFIDKYKQYSDMILDYANSGISESSQEYAKRLSQSLLGSAENYTSEYLNNEQNINDMRSALKNLTGEGWFTGKFKGNKEEFVNKANNPMKQWLYAGLYDAYELNEGDDRAFKTYIDDTGNIQTVNKLSQLSNDQLLENVLANIFEPFKYDQVVSFE